MWQPRRRSALHPHELPSRRSLSVLDRRVHARRPPLSGSARARDHGQAGVSFAASPPSRSVGRSRQRGGSSCEWCRRSILPAEPELG